MSGGIAPTYGYFKFSPDRITVAPLQGRRDLITWRESIEPQLEVARLKGFADGTVPIPPVDDVGLRGEFRAAHLLTFMVISRCCSPVVQLAFRSCRERLDAGHQAWHFILSTYQVRDDLYIAQLEEKMIHIRMGEQESATDYCNRARRILAEMRMAGAEYSTASYISHIVKGLPRGYNLIKRMMMVPGTRESLDKDSITGYILQDEAMQEVEQPTELLLQANYAAPTKLNQQSGQRRMHGGGGSGGGRSKKDVDEKGRRETSKKTSSTKDVDSSSGKSRGDGEASCSMVGVVELTITLAPEAGKDFQAVAAAVQANPMAVLLDSGCSHHLMGTKAVFVDMAPSGGVKHVSGFNGALQPVEGHGTIALQGEAGKRVLIPDVLYVPGVQANLLSAGQLKERGVQLRGDGDEMLLVATTGKVLGRAHYTGRVLCTDLRPCSTWSQSTEVVALRTIVSTMKSTPDRLHSRLAHISVDTIKSSAKHEVATGLDITPSTGADPPCVSCVRGKLARHTFPAKGSNTEEALAVVHIDLCRPFRVAAKDGSMNFLLLKDCHTQFVWVMPVAKKSDVLREFQKWLVLVERQMKKSVMMLRSDRGGEFLGKEFTDFIDGKGIVHDLTCPYPPLAWVWACMVHLEALSVAPACGIAGGRQGAKLVDQDGKPSTIGEQQTREPVEQEAAAEVQSTKELLKSAGGEQLVESSNQLIDDLIVDEEGELSAGEESTNSDVVEVLITTLELRRTGRARRPPEQLSFHTCLPPAAYDEVDDDLLYDDAEEDDELPELDPDMHADPEHRWDIATMTVKEALASWKGEAVKAAMEEEIRSLIGMGTWELVKRPRGVNIMKSWWVLTTKYRLDDTVEREKARLVVKGFTQVCCADYDETYSPVSNYVTLRIFLSIVAVFDLNLMQLDMKNAFLQSKLDMVLYMYKPDYFDDGTGRKSQVDEALYFKASENGVTCWVLVYVDDLLATSSSPAMLKELKQLLEDAFELREILPVIKYLGRKIVRDRPARKLWLHQQGYADKLRRRFIDEEQGGRVPKMPVSVDANTELTFDDEEAQERKEEEYRQKVCSLQFAATTTRPDIAFACSKLGSGLTVWSDEHWREVNHCLAYLADTRDTAMEFGGGPESLEMIGYVDADGAGNKQNSEYVAATNAGKEGRRLRFLLAEFKLLNAGNPTLLHVNNKSAITVAEGLGLTGNLKHMERRYAWLQHMVRRGKFVLKYIPTTEQLADFLTKALHFLAFNRCSVAIGQVCLADVGDGGDDVQSAGAVTACCVKGAR
ncbi:unnamed protein product [Closterium sp. NIES-54]